jgi:hypothetical protein
MSEQSTMMHADCAELASNLITRDGLRACPLPFLLALRGAPDTDTDGIASLLLSRMDDWLRYIIELGRLFALPWEV